MFTTWGYSPTEATLAVAAGRVFSIGIKLVLPLVAAIGLLVSNTPIDGTLRTIVVIAVLVGVGVLGVASCSPRSVAPPGWVGCSPPSGPSSCGCCASPIHPTWPRR